MPVTMVDDEQRPAVSRAEFARPVIHNPSGLERWRIALASAMYAPVWVGVIGSSSVHGVGADGSASTSGDEAAYRERGFVTQLSRLFASTYGPAGIGMVGARPGWGFGATLAGAPTPSGSIGPFGNINGNGAGINGGYQLDSAAKSVTYPAAAMGPFTAITLPVFGSANGLATPREPLVTVDGVAVNSPSATGAGLTKTIEYTTITGLSDAPHEVVVSGLSSGVARHYGFVAHRDRGVVVNRIGASGATIVNLTADDQTGGARERIIESALLAERTKLVILHTGANDESNQTPIDTYGQRVQEIVTRVAAQGGCVLIVGQQPNPAVTSPGPLTAEDYRAALREIAASHEHCAMIDIRDLWGTDHATAYSQGLYVSGSSVHMSLAGHGDTARLVHQVLTAGMYSAV